MFHPAKPIQPSRQPRARGGVRLGVRDDEAGKTGISTLRQSGSSKLVFPRRDADHVEAVYVNTAGGVTGGDRFDIDLDVGAGARLTLTTQAAERAYRAQHGETARITTTLSLEHGATLHWLPQELILFERCNLARTLDVALQGDARFIMVEPVVFGRTAMGETLNDAALRDRVKITRDGTPIYIDGVNLHGDVAAHLARAATAMGANAMASVVMAAPNAQAHLAAVRNALPVTAGTSALGDDLLVVRLLAPDSFDLRRSLIPVLELLTQSPLPLSWRL